MRILHEQGTPITDQSQGDMTRLQEQVLLEFARQRAEEHQQRIDELKGNDTSSKSRSSSRDWMKDELRKRRGGGD